MPAHERSMRAPLLWVLIPGIGGLALGRLGVGSGGLVWPGAAAGFATVSLLCLGRDNHQTRRPAAGLWSVCLIAAMLFLGLTYFHRANHDLARWHALPPREADLTIEITRVFAAAPDSSVVTGLGRIITVPHPIEDIRGQRVAFALPRPDPALSPWLPTTRLAVRGVLEPVSWKGISAGFDEYLDQTGVHFRFSRATVKRMMHPASGWQRWCRRLADQMEYVLRTGFPVKEPVAAVYVAMCLGRKGELAPREKNLFMRSGTMHLFAISGLHIGVVAFCLYTLLRAVRLPEWGAAVLGLLLLFGFVAITGETPSAVRAYLMVAVFWLARLLARPSNALSALAVSGILVLAAEPLQLFSVGFQLSYAVVTAILLYGLPLAARWQRRWQPFAGLPAPDHGHVHRAVKRAGDAVLGSLAISLAATLVSTPLILSAFGLITPGGVLANLAVIPLAGLTIVAGMAALSAAALGAIPLVVLFNHSAWLLLVVLEKVVALETAIPGFAQAGAFCSPALAPITVVAILTLMFAGRSVGWERLPGKYLAPWLPLAAVLIFGVTFSR